VASKKRAVGSSDAGAGWDARGGEVETRENVKGKRRGVVECNAREERERKEERREKDEVNAGGDCKRRGGGK